MTKSDLKISFTATLFQPATTAKTGSPAFLILPKDASRRLPSRGMTSAEGTINGSPFLATLEPDGKGSHLLRLDQKMQRATRANVGDIVSLEIAPAREEPEPHVPADLKMALTADPKARKLWTNLTPKARRDWIHWIASAKQSETRTRRIDVTCSKLASGKRRPCCFNYLCPVENYEAK